MSRVAVRARQRSNVSPARARIAVPRRPVPSNDAATLAFLADILVGETQWRLSEVQHLLALHTLVGVGRWHASGLDDLDPEAG